MAVRNDGLSFTIALSYEDKNQAVIEASLSSLRKFEGAFPNGHQTHDSLAILIEISDAFTLRHSTPEGEDIIYCKGSAPDSLYKPEADFLHDILTLSFKLADCIDTT